MRPTERASAEVGRGGGAKRPAGPLRPAHWRGGRVSALNRCEQLEPILLAHVRVGDHRDMVEQAAPEAGLALRRGQRLGVELVAPELVDQRFGPLEQRLQRARGRWCGSNRPGPGRRGRVTKPSERPGPDMGERPQRRAHRRFLPGRVAVEAEQGRGESRQSRPSWASVRAVPSGATASPIPAWSSAITSIWPSTTTIRFASRLAGAALSRLNRVRPLSNKGVSGEFRYLGSPLPEDAAAEGDHPPARIADREHQPAAEAVIGLALVLGRDQQAGLDQLVVAELLERRPELAARIGGEAEIEFPPAWRRKGRGSSDSRAPRRLRCRRAGRRTIVAAAAITS